MSGVAIKEEDCVVFSLAFASKSLLHNFDVTEKLASREKDDERQPWGVLVRTAE